MNKQDALKILKMILKVVKTILEAISETILTFIRGCMCGTALSALLFIISLPELMQSLMSTPEVTMTFAEIHTMFLTIIAILSIPFILGYVMYMVYDITKGHYISKYEKQAKLKDAEGKECNQ